MFEFIDIAKLAIKLIKNNENIKNEIKSYINYLEKQNGWKAITYTPPNYGYNCFNELSYICTTNAHHVIGQEFNKVVFVMDNNFNYDENGKLIATLNYYSAQGMLYQIVTRVVNELKILVLNNPDLYFKLLQIKAMGDKS